MNRSCLLKSLAFLAFLIAVQCGDASSASEVVKKRDAGSTIENKPNLVVQLGHSRSIIAGAFAVDNSLILTGSRDNFAVLWEVGTGREVRRFSCYPEEVSGVAISPDKRFVATGSNTTIRLWELDNGREVWRFETGSTGIVRSVSFSPDGRLIKVLSQLGTTKALAQEIEILTKRKTDSTEWFFPYSITTDEERRIKASLPTFKPDHQPFFFSLDHRLVLVASYDRSETDNSARIFDVVTGREVQRLEGSSFAIYSVAFSPDGRSLLTGGNGTMAHLWDLITGRETRRLSGDNASINSVEFSPGGESILTATGGRGTQIFTTDGKAAVTLWNRTGGTAKHFLTADGSLADGALFAKFSPDGRYILVNNGSSIRVLNPVTGREIWQTESTQAGCCAYRVAFSHDGHLIAGATKKGVVLWKTSTGENAATLESEKTIYSDFAFSPDGRFLLGGGSNGVAQLWELNSGQVIKRFVGHDGPIITVAFSPDGDSILTGSGNWIIDGRDSTVRLWDVATGKELHRFVGHAGGVLSVAFSPDGLFVLSGGQDHTTRLWNATTGQELCRIVSLKDGSWVVVDSEGRFDASNGGSVKDLYWVVGTETIDLHQLKERYYEPGLLAKLTGFNKETLRNVEAFKDLKLYPTAQWKPASSSSTRAKLTLTNRGGGIGKVQIFVNGREVIADARGPNPDPNRNEEKREIDLQQFKRFMVPGEENKIEVIAYNAEGYLASRGAELVYVAPLEEKIEPPNLFALVVGVSNYREGGSLRDLTFAAKDAEAMATVFKAAGDRLFPSRTSVTLLSTSSDKPEHQPTKQNIVNSLKQMASKAKSTDILLLYFAGHGVSYGGQDGDFYFLTTDASTGDLKDTDLRDATALSSKDLAKLVLNIPANKQVMILDTCASGRLIEELTKSRSVDSSTIRAWDRMKDRTGLWVLAGSAADAVSYESSRYGQGVLTYSLLRGMKVDFEKALRKGEGDSAPEFVDVSALFNYSADAVPLLAQGIGGIQKPLIASKRDARSFDIGRINATNRAIIPYTVEKPVYLRAHFELTGRPRDTLELTSKIEARLRENSARGLDAPLVFWDLPQHPGAYRIAGRYEMNGTHISVQVFVSTFTQAGERIEEKDVGQAFTIEGDASDVEELVTRILEKTDKLIASLKK